MPNIWLKLSGVLGAWFASAVVLLIAPILFFPFTLIGWHSDLLRRQPSTSSSTTKITWPS